MTRELPLILWLIPLLALVAGVALSWLGWRGRQIDNHPICRKCGFDLFGLDRAVKCPECGTDLSPRMIRLGHRRLRRLPFALGLLLLLPSLTIVAALIVATAKNVDPDRYKPVWWLLRDGDARALAELNRRLSKGELADGSIERVVEAALVVQADPKRTWLVEWGNFVESARDKKKVGDDQWKRFVKQSIPFALVARPNVRRGDQLPVRVHYGPVRLGNKRVGGLDLVLRPGRTLLSGVKLKADGGAQGAIFFNAAGLLIPSPIDVPQENVTEGPNTLQMEVAVTIIERELTPRSRKSQELLSYSVATSALFELVSRDQPVVEIVADTALDAQVQHALTLHSFSRGGGGRSIRVQKDYLHFGLLPHNLPIDLACDVFLRAPSGREWRYTTLTASRDGSSHWKYYERLEGFDADRVDVILRPNPAAAAETVDITRIWGGEIRFRDVPVIWEAGAPRPTSLPTTRATASRPTSAPARR